MFALTVMPQALRVICFLVALVLFVLSACGAPSRVNLTAAGLAVFVLPFLWDALATAP